MPPCPPLATPLMRQQSRTCTQIVMLFHIIQFKFSSLVINSFLCLYCRPSSSTKKTEGCSTNDLDWSEYDGGHGLIAGTDANSAVTGKQCTQTPGTVGRHRVVARFDGRPRQLQSLNQGCLSTAYHPGISRHQQATSADTSSGVVDVNELTLLPDDGDQTYLVLSSILQLFLRFF